MLAFLLAGNTTAVAASEDATKWFQAGRAAFEAQDYAAALDAFEAAVREKLQGPAVHFNIGVVAYRLGRYDRAEAAFLEAARTPSMAALSRYNLGLVALARADKRTAEKWFELVATATDSDERLRQLASRQLAALPPPPSRNWAGYAALGAGYDDNVALVSNSDVLGISGLGDAFGEGQFALSAPLGQPWRLDAGLMLLDYRELDSFDQVIGQAGASYRMNTGRWASEAALEFAYTLLDGTGFDNEQIVTLQTGTKLDAHWSVSGRYRFSNIDGLNDFTGVGGHRHEVSVRAGWNRDAWTVGAMYRFDTSDLRDESLSATSHQIAINVQRAIGDEWLLAGGLARRHRSYDANGAEDRTDFDLAIEKQLGRHWRFVFRYIHTRDAADLPEFDYDDNRVSAGVQAFL